MTDEQLRIRSAPAGLVERIRVARGGLRESVMAVPAASVSTAHGWRRPGPRCRHPPAFVAASLGALDDEILSAARWIDAAAVATGGRERYS